MIVRKHASFSAFTCVVAVLVLALARGSSPTQANPFQDTPPCLATVTATTIERVFDVNDNTGHYGLESVPYVRLASRPVVEFGIRLVGLESVEHQLDHGQPDERL